MSFKISTVKLQDMVVRSMRGVGNNKLLPITSLMNISISEGKLVLITTDGVNYMYIKEPVEVDEDFYVTVEADKFSKLISKMTCEDIVLELKDTYLQVRGNGVYKIDLPLDFTVNYPDPMNNKNTLESIAFLDLSTVKDILFYIKPSLATTMEIPCYTGYYMHDSVIATDTNKIACLDTEVFEQPKLVSAEMMDMLSVMTDDTIEVFSNDESIAFVTEHCCVYGDLMAYINDFQIDAINKLLENKFNSRCEVARNALLQCLDRLSIFVGAYDSNLIHMNFEEDCITIFSKSADAYESVPYLNSEDVETFDCYIDIQMLQSQVKSQENDSVDIRFGERNSIMLCDGDVTKMIALASD